MLHTFIYKMITKDFSRCYIISSLAGMVILPVHNIRLMTYLM